MSWIEARWWDSRACSGAMLAPLAPAEWGFRAGAALRAALFERGLLPRAAVPAPVVSIGNLAVGGAGKTPAAIAVARLLHERGRRVAVLSRGYGADRTDPRVVSDGERILLDASEAGDEPLVIARALPGVPVLCGPKRVAIAGIAIERLRADALVLDDGFQHRGLERDLDIVVVDASNPRGNGHLLPRGPNREPWTALSRAGLVWLSRVDGASPAALQALRTDARRSTGQEPVESIHAPAAVLDGRLAREHGLATLRGAPVVALTGLARPQGFQRTLEGLGARVVAARAFRDHHAFTEAELEEAFAAAARRRALVATTEKDVVRLSSRWAAHPALRVIRIEAKITAGAAVLDRLLLDALVRGDRRREQAAPARARTDLR
jgi:tetraacyldisaccharide 4'-kinase